MSRATFCALDCKSHQVLFTPRLNTTSRISTFRATKEACRLQNMHGEYWSRSCKKSPQSSSGKELERGLSESSPHGYHCGYRSVYNQFSRCLHRLDINEYQHKIWYRKFELVFVNIQQWERYIMSIVARHDSDIVSTQSAFACPDVAVESVLLSLSSLPAEV